MEEKDGLIGSGVTVKGDEAPQSFRVEHRVENSGGSAPPAPAPAPASVAAPTTEMKKKRGRPRKYAGDGSVVALSPMPISASIPLTGDYSSDWKQHSAAKPVDSFKKKHRLEFESRAQGQTSVPLGESFTPHVLTVNTGEDIMMKIISFSQQGSRAICILAANGTISNVTLRQPNSSGGTLTYEGRFEILSLTGSFMLSDYGLTKSRSGGLSVTLAGPDGRVLGGGLAGMLIAAGPVQVVIGSFPHGQQPQQQQQEQKPKKQKYEHTIAFAPSPANPISEHRYDAAAYSAPKSNFPTSISFNGDNNNNNNLASFSNMHHGSKMPEPESNVSLLGEDSREPSHELTC